MPKSGFRDAITTHIDIELNLRDRLRVLLGYRPSVTVVVHCENLPGEVESDAKTRFLLPKWRVGRRRAFEGTPS